MNKMSSIAICIMATFTLLVSVTAEAGLINLVKNGSFENTSNISALGGHGSSNTWQIYSTIPNWSASKNVEIWTNNFIVPAYDGNNVLELNAHSTNFGGQFSIFQTISTDIGQTYNLSFVGRRRDANSDEGFSVSIGDLFVPVTNQLAGQWNEYNYQFKAVSNVSMLTFTSLDNGRDTTGNIFDDVQVTPVSEPSTLLMLGLALAGLFVRKYKR